MYQQSAGNLVLALLQRGCDGQALLTEAVEHDRTSLPNKSIETVEDFKLAAGTSRTSYEDKQQQQQQGAPP